jgi:ABC-2 type transport system permease protein
MQVLGQLGITVIEFFSIWALFHRFQRLGEWTLPEVGVFYGAVGMAWALADAVGRSFDNFGQVVKAGDFDRILLRPRSTVFQLLAQGTQLRRFGRMLQAGTVLGWAWLELGIGASPERMLLLAVAIAGGAALFLGLLVVQATIAFWTVESLEIMNVMTYGGVTTAQYPLSIYPDWLRRFFVFFVPLGVTLYFPIVKVLGKTDPLGSPEWLGWAGPLAGGLFLAAALQVWRLGVRYYTSTGS